MFLSATDKQSIAARVAALEKRLGLIPVTEGDFAERENQALKQWNGASQGLQRLNLQVDTLQATINGLRRMLREGPQTGVVRDPSAGFDPNKLPCPTDEQNLFSDHGRGIYLINRLMDEVRYDRNGTEIHMRKY